MIVVGITGGIGSGKTTVCNEFKQLEIPCFIADIEAKKLIASNKELKTLLIKEFGEKTYVDNVYNSPYIASIVFKNLQKLEKLNAIVHPFVRNRFYEFKNSIKTDVIIYEAAILFESGSSALCDYIITVTAPLKDRVERVMKRDNSTENEVLNRINNQSSDIEKIKKSHFVIKNTSQNVLNEKVTSINLILRKIAIKSKIS